MSLREPLSTAELLQFARDYAEGLPGWVLFHDDHFLRLSRAIGPVNQNIWFGSASDGYRLLLDLTVDIPALKAIGDPTPWVAMASTFLGQRVGSRFSYIRPSEHAAKWRQAVDEMDTYVVPAIRKPLDMAGIAEVCAPSEREDLPNDLVMMSVIYTWLGKNDEARRRCIRLQAMPVANPATEMWERTIRSFALDLARAIEAGRERQFLDPTPQNDNQPGAG